jgi:hypothetical protein
MSFLAAPYPQLGWKLGRLPITAGSGMPASFRRKNHSFHHPTDGLDTERTKYESTPYPVWT